MKEFKRLSRAAAGSGPAPGSSWRRAGRPEAKEGSLGTKLPPGGQEAPAAITPSAVFHWYIRIWVFSGHRWRTRLFIFLALIDGKVQRSFLFFLPAFHFCNSALQLPEARC